MWRSCTFDMIKTSWPRGPHFNVVLEHILMVTALFKLSASTWAPLELRKKLPLTYFTCDNIGYLKSVLQWTPHKLFRTSVLLILYYARNWFISNDPCWYDDIITEFEDAFLLKLKQSNIWAQALASMFFPLNTRGH